MATSIIKSLPMHAEYIGLTNGSGATNFITADFSDNNKYPINNTYLVVTDFSITMVRKTSGNISLIGFWALSGNSTVNGFVLTAYAGAYWVAGKIFRLIW